jgi:hypothetical protein
MAKYCLECGGELAYDPVVKQYVCKSCGLIFSFQQLMEEKDKVLESKEGDLDRKKRKQNEYLKWWLAKKD